MKNLLVLVPDYPDEHNRMIGSLFVKEQLAHISKNFDNVYVIAPVLKSFGLTMQSKYCENYKVENISVFFPTCLFYPRAINIFPVPNSWKLYIDNRYSVILKTIKDNNLKFDLIHSHMTFPATYAACKLKEEYHVPVVATIHEDTGWLLEEIAMHNESKIDYAWENSDVLIRVNKSEIPLLKDYNKDVRYVPNGFTETYMPLNQMLCRDVVGIDQCQKIIFTYGYFDERKGFQTLIEAMSHLKGSGVKCYIAGRGPYKPYLEKFVDDYGLLGDVKILGFMSDISLCNWINAADLFIFPSLRESFGITQVNALACGVPVVASTNVGSQEIVCSACGDLYRAGDAKNLAQRIFLDIEQHWDHKAIRNYTELHYSWKGISNQLMYIYEELL